MQLRNKNRAAIWRYYGAFTAFWRQRAFFGVGGGHFHMQRVRASER